MLSRVLALTAALLSLPFLLGCQKKTAIWLIRGTTVDHLQFGLSREVGDSVRIPVGFLRVGICAGPDYGIVPPHWVLLRTDPSASVINRVTYGVEPLGYTSDSKPRSLTPGCYHVFADGGRLQFEVDHRQRVYAQPFAWKVK